MDKNGVVTISDFQKGQVKHPIYGFGLVKNLEIFENQGIAKLANKTTNTGIAVTQLPIAEVRDIDGNIYTLTGETGSGVVYKNGTSIRTGRNNAWDMAIYKNYLWVRYGNSLDAYGPLNSAGAAWFTLSSSFDATSNGKLLVGQDDFLYSGNGNFIAKIEVTSSGTVGVAPTLNIEYSALDLPDGQYATTLVEYGTNIMIGTCGSPFYWERNNIQTARLYPWNRQLGTLGNPGLADLPVVFNENGINAVIQHANKLYVQAGSLGNVYVSDGVNYQLISQLPYVEDGVGASMTCYSNAMTISSRGTLFVGVSVGTNYGNAGVYEIDIANSKYPVCLKHTISTGTVNSSSGRISIGFVRTAGFNTLRVGWQDVSTFGIDGTSSTLYSSYGGVLESPLIKVGSFNKKKTFEHIEFMLAEPLVSGQNIRISYRLNSKDAYTTIGTWGFSTIGGRISYEDVCAIADAEYLQLKIELDQAETTVYPANIKLLGVSVW